MPKESAQTQQSVTGSGDEAVATVTLFATANTKGANAERNITLRDGQSYHSSVRASHLQ